MALPIASTPTYDLVIPSTEKKVKFRPFLVKEEKALLIAQQSENLTVMIDTLKSVIASCVQGEVNVDSLAIFDLEYMFTQIRAKSVGEIVELIFSCQQCKDPKAKTQVNIDISKIQVKKDPEHSKKISLYGDVGVIMKYPPLDIVNVFNDTTLNDVDQVFKIICSSIDMIYSGEDVFYAKEHSEEELEDFVNNLTQEQFEKIKKFFETMPKLETIVEYTCPVCAAHNSTALEGIQNFF